VQALLDTHPSISIMLLTLDAGDRYNDVMGKAAAIGYKAGKLVVLRASPLSESRGIIPALWQNSNIIIVTEAEAAIALGVVAGQRHALGLSAPLSTLQQCSEAARLMLARSKSVAAVIVSSPMGVCCRYDPTRVHQEQEQVLPNSSADVATEVDNGAEYSIVLPCFRGPVVDVVGAVDALAGGIAGALSRGVPLSHALVWGTACCARSISEHGAQESMPTFDQLIGFFRMECIRVRDGRVPQGGQDFWPTDKPAIGRDLRELEELMHSGGDTKHAELGNRLAELKTKYDASALTAMLDTAIDFQGHTLLHLATLYSDVDCVATLLAYGASITVKDNYHTTPLQRCDIEFRAARKAAREK
jgi:sugar/nucleoside kinase (ribokinase family)